MENEKYVWHIPQRLRKTMTEANGGWHIFYFSQNLLNKPSPSQKKCRFNTCENQI